jgi:NAD(P)-dependent dehydrogenase (short-subunit alcohol dehydrogenase family)
MSASLKSIGGSSAVDWILDRSVLPGFSSIGYDVRGLAGASADPEHHLRGRDVVVTGANSGIGAAAAEQFAALGATVHLVVRNLERGEDARARISEATGSDHLYVHRCDVSSLESVRTAASELTSEIGQGGIAALVHNAGMMTRERGRSEDGYELTLATHVLGPLLLTELLAPLLERAAPSKVVFVTSGGMYSEKLDVDDLELDDRDFNGTAFYAHAKRIQVILTGLLDSQLGPRGISVHAMHPGWVDTPGVVEALPRFHSTLERILRTPAQGADTIVWLAASDEAAEHGGELWMDRRIRPAHRVPWTHESPADRARLWSRLSEMAGLTEPQAAAPPG